MRDLVVQVLPVQLIYVHYVVVSVLPDGASETNSSVAVFAESFDFFFPVIEATFFARRGWLAGGH